MHNSPYFPSLDLQQWLAGVLQNEFSEFEMDILLEDIILKELIEEQYQWYAYFKCAIELKISVVVVVRIV